MKWSDRARARRVRVPGRRRRERPVREPAAPSVPAPFTITDLRVGTGARPRAVRRERELRRAGCTTAPSRTRRATQFDASKPGRPFVFWLGACQVIQGWDQGVVGHEGRRPAPPDRAQFDSPTAASGAGNTIPPNASLVFEIELVSVFSSTASADPV